MSIRTRAFGAVRAAYGALVAIVLAVAFALPASADAPARTRTLTCTDGSSFTGEQVRSGLGLPPHTWRNVDPGEFPTAFVFFAAAVILPDGTVVDDVTWDNSQGVSLNNDLITCSFIIPIGELAGAEATFTGYFVP